MSTTHGLVHWREWSEESFAAAKAQDKPILLDIGAVWCHWCHVMDDGIPGDPVHTGTYSNPDIARVIEERYIPIKVDNDRRPDINTRYNQGGWPTTVFLSPDGKMLYGETYVEPKRMIGLLAHVADYYRDNKDKINAALNEQEDIVAGSTPLDSLPTDVPSDISRSVAAAIKSNFDAVYGGFGSQPKFPHPEALILAIEEWRRTGDEALKEIVTLTLTGMAGGGMYDRFAGGFFRYSTTRNWSVPHYEKMTQDNARLSMACLLAGAAFDDSRFTDVALDVHNFMLNVMRSDETGCFGGSQDADMEEHYYGLPRDERALLPTPYIDWTVYVDWNAMMVSSLILRYKLVEPDPNILVVAEQVYAFIAKRIYPNHYFADGKAGGETGMLTDLVSLIEAASALYEVTGQLEYLADASRFADTILADLTESESGGFYDIRANPEAIGALAEPRVDLIQTSEAALGLFRLTGLTGDGKYQNAAYRAVARFAKSFQRHSFMAGAYGRAAAAAVAEHIRVVIVGDDETAEPLQRAAWSVDPIGLVVDRRSVAHAGEYPPGPNSEALAYVCVGTSCRPPAATSQALLGELRTAMRQAPTAN